MFYYKAVISYDGTNYQGWQSQPHKKTVQDTFIKYFRKTFGLDITITGASRTDAGVHALGQSIGIKTRLDLNAEHIRMAISAGVKLAIDSDAHDKSHLEYLKFGIAQARRGWAQKKDIINAWPLKKMISMLKH